MARVCTPHARGPDRIPQIHFIFCGWERLVVFQITNVPFLHSDEGPGGPVPSILPVYAVNW
jgi:hypothetical protein